jgi:hypothetical protein
MSLAILLLGLLPGFFQNIPGLSTAIKQIIADVSGSAAAVLASGSVTQPNINTILAAWAGVVAVLKADPSLPQATLAIVGQLEKAVQAALTNDHQAALAVDWSKVGKITPVA